MAAMNEAPGQGSQRETGLIIRRPDGLEPHVPARTPRTAREPIERGFLEHSHILWRRRGILVFFVLLGITLGTIVTIYEEPAYVARTSLEFQPRAANLLRSESPEQPNFDESAIATYQHVLRSRSLRERVLERLKSQPAGNKSNAPQSSSLLLEGIEKLGLNMGMAPRRQTYRDALHQAADTLKAKTIPQTRIVEITCESGLPWVASTFANGLVNEFIDEDLQSHWNSTQSTNKQLTEELQQLRRKMEESERNLNDYAEKNGITLTSTNATLLDDQLKATQQDLARAENERVGREVSYRLALTSGPDSTPGGIDDPVLQHDESELADLKRQLADLGSTFTPAYFKVKAIQAEITELEDAERLERTKAVERLKTSYEEALRRQQVLAAAYQKRVNEAGSESRRFLQYGTLKNDFEANRQLYESVSRRVKELDITSAVHTSNIRVIDTAEPPAAPDRPNPVRNLGLGILGGVLCGATLVFWKEYINAAVWRPGESVNLLQVPELGVVPSHKFAPGKQTLTFAELRTLVPIFSSSGYRPKEQETRSRLAESFRRAVVSILFSNGSPSQACVQTRGTHPQVIVVTSPGPNEGKSTICSNLAIGFAEISLRVLVVDCDLRKPTLHKMFDVSNTWGISNILAESTDIDGLPKEAVCRETKIPGTFILTSGPPPNSVSQLLFSSRLGQLMIRLRKEFDIVLIDTPPALRVSDARALSRQSDGTVLVLRAGHSKAKAAMATTRILKQDGSPVFGTILNDWDPRGGGAEYAYEPYYDAPRALYD